MSSSFDTEQVSQADRSYQETMALYAAIKDTPGIMRVRRAEMRQGEVQAEPIDFVIDVELKARRALQQDIDPVYAVAEWLRILDAPEQYATLPVAIREEIGNEFLSCGLGVDGAYRMLYWRVKNRQAFSKEEVSDGIIFE